MNLNRLDILRFLNILPEKVYYNPFDRSYFKSTKGSRIVPNNSQVKFDSFIKGINPNKVITITNCIPMRNSLV